MLPFLSDKGPDLNAIELLQESPGISGLSGIDDFSIKTLKNQGTPLSGVNGDTRNSFERVEAHLTQVFLSTLLAEKMSPT